MWFPKVSARVREDLGCQRQLRQGRRHLAALSTACTNWVRTPVRCTLHILFVMVSWTTLIQHCSSVLRRWFRAARDACETMEVITGTAPYLCM